MILNDKSDEVIFGYSNSCNMIVSGIQSKFDCKQNQRKFLGITNEIRKAYSNA